MAWSFVGVSAVAEAASGNLTLTEPAGVASGDLLVAAISYRSNAAFTLPSGWSLVATQQSSGNTSTGQATSIGSGVMAYIVRGGSAPDLTFTRTAGDVALGHIVAYRGGHATPYDTGSANTMPSNSLTVTTPSLTTAEADELLVAAGCIQNNFTASGFLAATDPAISSGTTTNTSTPPTAGTWLRRVTNVTTTGADVGIGIADAIKATAGATGTLQCTDDTGTAGRPVLIVGAFKIAATGGYTTTIDPAALPVIGATITALYGYATTLTAGTLPIVGATITPTYGYSASLTPASLPISGATITPVYPGGYTTERTPASIPITGGTITPLSTYLETLVATAIPIDGGTLSPTHGYTETLVAATIPIVGSEIIPELIVSYTTERDVLAELPIVGAIIEPIREGVAAPRPPTLESAFPRDAVKRRPPAETTRTRSSALAAQRRIASL